MDVTFTLIISHHCEYGFHTKAEPRLELINLLFDKKWTTIRLDIAITLVDIALTLLVNHYSRQNSHINKHNVHIKSKSLSVLAKSLLD